MCSGQMGQVNLPLYSTLLPKLALTRFGACQRTVKPSWEMQKSTLQPAPRVNFTETFRDKKQIRNTGIKNMTRRFDCHPSCTA